MLLITQGMVIIEMLITVVLVKSNLIISRFCLIIDKIFKFDNYFNFGIKNIRYLNYLIVLIYVLLLFSPAVSWLSSILFLILFTGILTTSQRRMLALNVVISGSLIIASRKVFAYGASDDFVVYNRMYDLIANGIVWVDSNGNPDDIGIKIVFFIIFKLFGNIDPSTLLFLISLFISLLFLLWMELYGIMMIKKNNYGLMTASTFIFYSYFHSTQLTPQMLSSVLLLYSLFAKNRFIFILFFIMGSAVHITGSVVFVLIYGVLKYPKYFLPLFVSLILIFVGLNNELRTFYLENNIEIGIIRTFLFHMEHSTESYCLPDLQFIRYFVAMFVMYLYLLICDRKDKMSVSWNSFILMFVMLYYILMPLCLGPLRGTLILNSVLLGFALFKGFEKVPNFYSILLIYVLYGKFSYFLKKIPGDFQLFYTYDWYGFQPFYYFR